MKTTRVGDHTLQLTRFPLFFPVAVFLVREEDGFTLIDTAIPGSAEPILAAAEANGGAIRRIALTHAHLDHVGSLDLLRAALPEAEVVISARDSRFLAGDHRLDPNEPQTKPRGSFQKRLTRPTRLLQPGDRVGSLEVVAAPGHTPGHVAFIDTRDRTLIAGDAFQTQGGLAVSGVLKPRFPFPALATWHKPTALRSAEALRSLDPARLAVGHGPPLNNPVPALDAAIAEARQAFADEA